MSSRYPAHDLDFEHLTLDKLQEIVPVASTDRHDHIHFTVQSLERYEAGFIVNFDVELYVEIPTPEPGDDPSNLPPELQGTFVATTASDDLGNFYAGFMRAGHGGGRSDGVMVMRFVYVFTPGLAPNATDVTLTVRMVEHMRYHQDGSLDLGKSEVTGGPWELPFSLRATARKNQSPIAVVPIARQLRRENVSLTILSLERSTHGFHVVARLDWIGATGPFPRIIWQATDNLGNSYRTANCAGGGGGAIPPDAGSTYPHSWRMDCIFSRPIAADATQITLSVEAVVFQTPLHLHADPAQPHWHQTRQLVNLGSFIVDLA